MEVQQPKEDFMNAIKREDGQWLVSHHPVLKKVKNKAQRLTYWVIDWGGVRKRHIYKNWDTGEFFEE